MTLLIYINLIFGVLYFLIISSFIFGLRSINQAPPLPFSDTPINKNHLSLIIPFRNEEKNLPNLIKSLNSQTLPSYFYEIIFVNDFSDDKSGKIIQNFIKNKSNCRLINSIRNTGKKSAIFQGISESTGKLIVTTDADCTYEKKWLETILNFHIYKKAKFIIGPVKMIGGNFLENFQALEFMSLTASTAGAALINRPFMCNGANIAFEKSVYNENIDIYNESYASGDDVFLLHKIKKLYKKEIYFLNNRNAIAYTNSEKTLKNFYYQRKRWASKAKGYKDFDAVFISIIVAIFNISIVITGIIVIYDTNFLKFFYLILLFKFIPDYIILRKASFFFKTKKLLRFFLIFSIIYPIYVSIISVSALFAGKIYWKRRNIK